jgi:ATP-dependent helicase YprA (DUF1998 family)
MDEAEAFGPHPPAAILEHFEAQGLVRRSGGRSYWASDAYPAEEVSLRTATPQNFVIHETTQGNRVLAEIDYDSAQEMIHKEAIYLHQARTYFVDELDWERRRAYVHEVEADYYTDAIAKSDLKVLATDQEEAAEARPGDEPPLFTRCFRRCARDDDRAEVQENPVRNAREHRVRRDRATGAGAADGGRLVELSAGAG